MQKIYFKKLVDLNHKLKELVSISVDESINYKLETQGMRAVGSILINGEYKEETDKSSFHESIDLDILAQFEKITDKRDFHVKVEDFDYSFNDGDLSLVIQACIYGVKDDEDRVIEAQAVRIAEEDDDIANEIESLIREEIVETVAIDEPVVEVPVVEVPVAESQPVVHSVETPKKVIVEKQSEETRDDEESDDLGTYYLYVVQDGDTYQSIATRYQCDEYNLKNYNHERSLSKGTIVIVPYYS